MGVSREKTYRAEHLSRYLKSKFSEFLLYKKENDKLFDITYNIALVFGSMARLCNCTSEHLLALSKDHPSTFNTLNDVALALDNQYYKACACPNVTYDLAVG